MNQPASRFAELFQRYQAETLSDAERRLLLAMTLNPAKEQELKELIEKELEKMPETSQVSPDRERVRQIFASIVANAGEKTGVLPTHRVHFLKTSWFRYAAAIILIAGITMVYFLTNQSVNSENHTITKTSVQKVAPGSNKAILTLASGKQIVLAAAQGNIIQQGNLKVTNSAGTLDYNGISKNSEYHTLSTPKGGQYKLILPDGTNVWLNAASSIKFPTVFAKERVVEIIGESYLEVAADRTKPFFVKTNGTIIQVLGTSFNVNAYVDEGNVKTTLLEGSIKIENNILKPGEAFVDGKIIPTNVDQDLAWKNGFFNFDNADLPTILRQLSRWYDIDIKYEGKIKEGKFGGKLSRDLSFQEVLETLKDMKVNFRIEKKTLIIQ